MAKHLAYNEVFSGVCTFIGHILFHVGYIGGYKNIHVPLKKRCTDVVYKLVFNKL